MSIFYSLQEIAAKHILADNHAHVNMHPMPCKALFNFAKHNGIQVIDVSTNAQELLKSLELQRCINSPTAKRNEGQAKTLQLPTVLHAHAIHPEYLHPNALQEYKKRIEPELYNAIQKTVETKSSNAVIDYAKNLLINNKHNIQVIGEFGLDTFGVEQDEIKQTLNLQIDLFNAYLHLAEQLNKPIMLHIRGQKIGDHSLYKVAFELIHDFLHTHTLPAVYFHSITAPWEYIKPIVDQGWYIGLNGIATYKSASYLLEVAKNTPASQILPETDAPFLIPNKAKTKLFVDKHTNEPLGVKWVVEMVKGVMV